jgi:hypothetical protein
MAVWTVIMTVCVTLWMILTLQCSGSSIIRGNSRGLSITENSLQVQFWRDVAYQVKSVKVSCDF